MITGRSFSFCADLCTAIIRHLDDKVPVPMKKCGAVGSTTNLVQNLVTVEHGESGAKHHVTSDEMFAMIQQFRKSKAKGKRGAGCQSVDGDHFCKWVRMRNRIGKDASQGWGTSMGSQRQ